jgi:hypothetical protein
MAKKSRATYIPNKNIQSLNVKNGKRVTEIKNKDILDGAYVKKGVKFKKGGNIDEYKNDVANEFVEEIGLNFNQSINIVNSYSEIVNACFDKKRNAQDCGGFIYYADWAINDGANENNVTTKTIQKINSNQEPSEKGIFDGYGKGGNLAMSIKNNIEKIIEIANENQDIKGYDIVLSGYSVKVSPDKRDDFWSDLEDIQQDYNVTFSVTDYDDLAIYTSEYEGDMFRTGGVAGSKHVDVTKGYRLPHGYKAVKGDDKNKNYSKGKPKVRVTKGWRLPKGYEVVEGAYNMKYEDGGTTCDYSHKEGGELFNPYLKPTTYKVFNENELVLKTQSFNKAVDYRVLNGKHLKIIAIDKNGNAKVIASSEYSKGGGVGKDKLKEFEIFKNGTQQGTVMAKNLKEAKDKVFAAYGEHREVYEIDRYAKGGGVDVDLKDLKFDFTINKWGGFELGDGEYFTENLKLLFKGNPDFFIKTEEFKDYYETTFIPNPFIDLDTSGWDDEEQIKMFKYANTYRTTKLDVLNRIKKDNKIGIYNVTQNKKTNKIEIGDMSWYYLGLYDSSDNIISHTLPKKNKLYKELIELYNSNKPILTKKEEKEEEKKQKKIAEEREYDDLMDWISDDDKYAKGGGVGSNMLKISKPEILEVCEFILNNKKNIEEIDSYFDEEDIVEAKKLLDKIKKDSLDIQFDKRIYDWRHDWKEYNRDMNTLQKSDKWKYLYNSRFNSDEYGIVKSNVKIKGAKLLPSKTDNPNDLYANGGNMNDCYCYEIGGL